MEFKLSLFYPEDVYENIYIINKYRVSQEELFDLETEGKGILFTGDLRILNDFKRKDITDYIAKFGFIQKSSVTKNVDYVVIGHKFGWTKIPRIEQLNMEKNCNIKILTEFDFINLINHLEEK